ncbi:MAG: PpiC-type peptidyl-prolyl cis-trans isomerase [Deltaproteobacteria bacterium]|nr:PpiC-type peptidyl-prolyl cis-trans isomerase [Deltaproteobacteria bacterium]
MLVAVPLAARADSSDASSKLLVDRVAAVVNDAVILTSELDLRLSPVRAEVMQITDRHERDRRLAKLATQLLDEMINDELVVQAAREAKITVEASEVQEAVDYIKRQNKLDDAQLAAAMKAQGITTSTLRNDLVRQRAVSQLVSPKVQVTEEDLRAHYDQMQRRSSTVSAVSLSQIVFELPDHPTEQQLTAARGKAQRALDRIKAGEEFAKVASEVSEDPSTKPTGGMLGWIEPSTLSATWEPVVFGMDKGEVRGPITGPKGLHLLFANEVKRTQLKPFADMKDELSQDLRRRALGKLTQSWIEELRKKAYIDIKLK